MHSPFSFFNFSTQIAFMKRFLSVLSVNCTVTTLNYCFLRVIKPAKIINYLFYLQYKEKSLMGYHKKDSPSIISSKN